LGMYDFKNKKLPYENENISYLYCVSKYPTNLEEIDMPDFENSFFTGYSDHTVGISACLHAVSKGALYLEKHFSTNKQINVDTQQAHICSMDYEDLNSLRKHADAITLIRNNL